MVPNGLNKVFMSLKWSLIVKYPLSYVHLAIHRITTDKIEKNYNYILNNYNSIKYEVENNIGSSMESHISHCIANMFLSRPKSYSSVRINKYLEINDYKNNHLNIFNLYLNSYEDTEQKEAKHEYKNFSIFERKDGNMPIINSTQSKKLRNTLISFLKSVTICLNSNHIIV